MSQAATIAGAMRSPAQPVVYRDEPEYSPPPYPYCERQLPPQFFLHVNQPAEDPPEYNFYDIERGSLIDMALAQYAQSISPGLASPGYSMLEHDEDTPRSATSFSGRIRNFIFYCIAMFFGITLALFWVCAIGYAIVVSFQKVAESLV
jgi:hypothetical protein